MLARGQDNQAVALDICGSKPRMERPVLAVLTRDVRPVNDLLAPAMPADIT